MSYHMLTSHQYYLIITTINQIYILDENKKACFSTLFHGLDSNNDSSPVAAPL